MDSEALLKGQAEIWKYMYSFADSMALKCAVELRIADIIDSNGKPTTLSQIVSAIPDTSSPDLTCLYRIMRLLVRRKIFTVDEPSDGGMPSYGLTPSSKWLLRDADLTLAPMILMENHNWLLDPWHYLDLCVKEGGIAFKKCHGVEIWDFASKNPEFNRLANEGMAFTARIVSKVLVEEYKDGFNSIDTLVDVGGGTGKNLAQIAKSFPHMKGINYDLPHVISTAPHYPNVTHVGGNMLHSIPKADAWVLHNWGDEDCVQILKNCRKAIPENGKVVIVDAVLEPEGEDLFDDARLVFDVLMIAHVSGGKERTESEWKNLLKEAGFPRYNIIKLPALVYIVEAHPN